MIQYRIFIGQVHIGLLVKGRSRTVNQAVQDMSQTFGILAFQQDIVDILQNGHLFVLLRMLRICQGFIFMCNSFSGIGFD